MGSESALGVYRGSVANVVNTAFRDIHLFVGLADVSRLGIVRFENVTLTNVTLQQGRVISTSANDYVEEYLFEVVYYPDDDKNYDFQLLAVPRSEQDALGGEFIIVEQVMSDCVFVRVGATIRLPGCPQQSVEKRATILTRGQHQKVKATFTYYDTYAEVSYYEAGHFENLLLQPCSQWLQDLQEVLGPLPPPPPAWPPYVLPPHSTAPGRTDLKAWPVPFDAVPELILNEYDANATAAVLAAAQARPPNAAAGAHGPHITSAQVTLLAVVAAGVLATAAVAGLWTAVALRRVHGRLNRTGRVGEPARGPQAHSLRLSWLSEGFQRSPVRSRLLSTADFTCFVAFVHPACFSAPPILEWSGTNVQSEKCCLHTNSQWCARMILF